MENWLHEPELAGKLNATDFPKDVDIVFDDKSRLHFRYAFVRYEGDFLVLYTEHCGYHSFPKWSIGRISSTSDLRD